MKKQVLIAAVAATMTSVAMADISITGAAKVNYKYTDNAGTTADTNRISREMDLKIKGQSGDTTVVMNIANDTLGSAGLSTEDSYVATKIGDINVKAGAWDNGNNALRASSRADGKASLSTTVSGVTVTFDTADGNTNGSGNDTIKVGGTVAGVNVSFKDVKTGEDIALSTTVGGVNVSYLALNRDTANTDRSVIEVGGSFSGVDVKYAQATAESATCIDGDSWMGDYENSSYTCNTTDSSDASELSKGQDVTAISLKTALAGNTVEFRNIQIDDVAGDDTSVNKFIVTRPLANGTTFEAVYTSTDDDGAATDNDLLDLELAVKF